MDELEQNIRKLRQYDNLGDSLYAIEKLVEEVLRVQEAQFGLAQNQQNQEIVKVSA